MVKDDQADRLQHLRRTSSSFRWAALAVAIICVATASGFLLAPRFRPPIDTEEVKIQNATGSAAVTLPLFRNWPKPDVALVLSGQQHGYLQPCGCSEPQKGGLARRYNFIRTLTDPPRNWPVVAADLGDVPQMRGPQALIKYRYSMMALHRLNYAAVGLGAHEMAQPLFNVLGEYALNNPSPRLVAANLQEKNFPQGLTFGPWEIREGKEGVPSVGLVGIATESVAKTIQDTDLRFERVEQTLPRMLREIQPRKPELLVLLCQGSQAEAKGLAAQFPQFQVILCLSADEEPSARPDVVGKTWIISVGHKGRYVGVLGVNRAGTAQAFDLRYELVALGPEYETPAGKDQDNPIHELLQKYAEEVKKDNYLAKYLLNQKHVVQINFPGSKYVGSQACKKCHALAHSIWEDSPHPHAYEALVRKAKRPTLRQYDSECVSCHVVGFGKESGFTDENTTANLKGVGCESCHGPASLHVKDPKNDALKTALNPWKVNAKDHEEKVKRIDAMCQKCHDQDNDVNYNFEKYWEPKKIAH